MICLLLPLALLRLVPGPALAAANCTAGDCKNGGVCNTFTDSPPCICPLPYIPPYCTAAVNYCSTLQPEKGITSLPVCKNNGNCTTTYSDPYFTCTCPPELNNLRCDAKKTTNSAAIDSPPATGTQSALAGGGIAGIVIGVLAIVVLAATGLAWWHYKKKPKIGLQQGTRNDAFKEATSKEAQIATLTRANPYAKPHSSQNSVPNISQNSVPNNLQNSVPNSSQNSVPNSSQNSVPHSSQNSVPNSSQKTVPNSSQNSVPNSLQNSVPNSSSCQSAVGHHERDRADTINETPAKPLKNATKQQDEVPPDKGPWGSPPVYPLVEESWSSEHPTTSSRLDPISTSRPSQGHTDGPDRRRKSKKRRQRSNAPVPDGDQDQMPPTGSRELLVESEKF